ncbi:hypothetical protein QVD99_000462 [Batrachochytrium dendrobatidis]|nr:hypothetical protein QVD99_000462 [Batrachochytrium dendrobatidis]
MFFISTFVFSLATSSLAALIPSNNGNAPVSLPGFYSPKPVANFSSQPTKDFLVDEISKTDLKSHAMTQLQDSLTLGDGVTIVPSTSFQDSHTGVYHCYVTQAVNNVTIANSVASISTDKYGNVISQTSSWVKVQPSDNANNFASLKTISSTDALVALAASMGISIDGSTLTATPKTEDPNVIVIGGTHGLTDQEITVEYKLYKTSSSLRPVWQVSLPLSVSWISAYVDKETGSVLGAADWSSSAVRTESGNIIPQGIPTQKESALLREAQKSQSKSVNQNASFFNGRRFQSTTSQRQVVQRRRIIRTSRRLPPTSRRSQVPRNPPNRVPQDPPTPAPQTPPTPEPQDPPAPEPQTPPAPAPQDPPARPNPQTNVGIPSSSYRVIPLGGRDPKTSSTALIRNPVDSTASPFGWHDLNNGDGSVSITRGNNVVAHDNSNRRDNPNTGLVTAQNFDFDFKFDDNQQEPGQYKDASITNVFFLSNSYHDILFKYGFDEQAGNFQNINAGGSGRGNDGIIAHVQDGERFNNANFFTPPDGRPGTMRMFLFNKSRPRRDSGLDNGIVLHELTHGLSTRLTGGPSNSNCLQFTEAGGMGEGWSDIVALVLEMLPTDTPDTTKVVGGYSTNDPRAGVRFNPYSTSTSVNPSTYARIRRNTEVHAIGEIWASMLYEVYWNLVEKLGFSTNIKDDAKSGKGNTLFLQLIVDGMKLQPCNPTLIQARDAIIQADKVANGGSNFCEITRGFAKRGMGIRAVDNGRFVDDFTNDSRCA